MDNLTKKQREKNMQHIRSANTKPELIIARELRKRKIYFSKHVSSIIGKPDFVFRKKKVVLFIDSCFWHKCPRHYIQPKSNLKYWIPKIDRNAERDKLVTKELQKKGWKVVRIWEHQIKHSPLLSINRVVKYLHKKKNI